MPYSVTIPWVHEFTVSWDSWVQWEYGVWGHSVMVCHMIANHLHHLLIFYQDTLVH